MVVATGGRWLINREHVPANGYPVAALNQMGDLNRRHTNSFVRPSGNPHQPPAAVVPGQKAIRLRRPSAARPEPSQR